MKEKVNDVCGAMPPLLCKYVCELRCKATFCTISQVPAHEIYHMAAFAEVGQGIMKAVIRCSFRYCQYVQQAMNILTSNQQTAILGQLSILVVRCFAFMCKI